MFIYKCHIFSFIIINRFFYAWTLLLRQYSTSINFFHFLLGNLFSLFEICFIFINLDYIYTVNL